MTQPLNYLTARPMLELLLGLHGYEAPQVTPEQALPAFLELLALPQADGVTDIGFQVEVVDENPDEGLLSIQLGARYPLPLIGVDDATILYRAVGLRWDLEVASPDQLAAEPMWMVDFPSTTAFIDAVRATPQWQLVDAAPMWQCAVLGEDE